MDNLPDLSALRSGDSDAWDQLHDWLHPVALAAAQHRLGNILPQDVEDIAVQAIEALVPKVAEVKNIDELAPLVASIACCRSIDRLRKHYRKPEQPIEPNTNGDDEPPEFEEAGGSEETIRVSELSQIVRSVLAGLKPKFRTLITDAFLHERSHKEIAEKHQMPIGSVGTTLKRALEAFSAEVSSQPRIQHELRGLLGLGQGLTTLLIAFL